ncbi:MAG: antibiotic biosynthesis monooxygenase [Betaproteobacteria bacterium]|nr:MAG: antibiotic biosynthesis monooxygenase [Betaproteobacteria bacterium]
MRFLLFNVKPRIGAMPRYLEIAAALRPELDHSGGCEFIDRFHQLPHAEEGGWMLSFQYWRDESAMVKWRNNVIHHEAQWSGRKEVFDDYRLRVGEVVKIKSPNAAAVQLAQPSASAAWVLLVESEVKAHAIDSLDRLTRFESIYRPGRFLHVIECASEDRAAAAFERVAADSMVDYATLGAIDREYGMYKRAEAPQVFPVT